MTPPEILAFFKEVDEAFPAKRTTNQRYLADDRPVFEYDIAIATQWVTQAGTALESVLPRHHAIIRQFESTLKAPGANLEDETTMDGLRGVFRAARSMLEGGRLSSLADGVRCETESELLDQAEQLSRKGHQVPAVVLAGGALETHLRALCVKNNLQWQGAGSISAYDAAIAQERNRSGSAVYGATDSKLVTAWGGTRNDAAHEPTKFSQSGDAVLLMIAGVRQFIAKTA